MPVGTYMYVCDIVIGRGFQGVAWTRKARGYNTANSRLRTYLLFGYVFQAREWLADLLNAAVGFYFTSLCCLAPAMPWGCSFSTSQCLSARIR